MQLPTYNGWYNRFTWLVYSHLSDEPQIQQEISDMVAREPNDEPAGRLVEMWVKSTLDKWMIGFAGRNRAHDESMYLLAWDLAGSAFTYAEWDVLVCLLAGENLRSQNLFTWTLYRRIRSCPEWYQQFERCLQETATLVACIDVLKAWIEEQLDGWVQKPSMRLQRTAPMSMLVADLIANTSAVIGWSDVARAFRPEY